MACQVQRVVITGIGLVTPLGVGALHNWEQIIKGASGIKSLTDPAYQQLPSRVAGLVPRGKAPHELDLDKHLSPSEIRTLSPAVSFALVAAAEALTDANWMPSDQASLEDTGVSIGTGMADLTEVERGSAALQQRYSKVSPHFVPRALANMASGHVSIRYGFSGPNQAACTACAAGGHAVGDAFRLVRHGDARVMVCGGAEAVVTPLAVAGFCKLRALSTTFNARPPAASRPFDAHRDGFVVAEGAGVLVLEALEHALARGARIYGEVLGYGLTGDAHHVTAPRPDGRGAERAMRRALAEAGVDAARVGYVNAHATSTPAGDAAEALAIDRVFGGRPVAVSSTKGAIGHLLGAAGAVEAALTVLAAHAAHIPPTVNLEEPITGVGLDLVKGGAKAWLQEAPPRIALSNSFGFGGTNASLCVASFETES